MRAYRCSVMMRMPDKVGVEYNGGLERWRICDTTVIDTAVEEMRDGNRKDVGRWRWKNGLEERRQTG